MPSLCFPFDLSSVVPPPLLLLLHLGCQFDTPLLGHRTHIRLSVVTIDNKMVKNG